MLTQLTKVSYELRHSAGCFCVFFKPHLILSKFPLMEILCYFIATEARLKVSVICLRLHVAEPVFEPRSIEDTA